MTDIDSLFKERGKHEIASTPEGHDAYLLGGVVVTVASTPAGQGHMTVCAQVVADVLGISRRTVLRKLDRFLENARKFVQRSAT